MKRYALWILVASVAVSALLGCVALLSSHFGETQGKVLLSTLAIAQASLLAMVCGVAMGRPSTAPLAKLGAVLAVATAPVLLAAIWGEIDRNGFWKATGTLEVAAITVAHVSLLLTARPRADRRWVVVVTVFAALALAAMIVGLVWGAFDDASGLWRPLGVLSILTCAGTILAWVFHRMDRNAVGVAAVASAGEAAATAAGATRRVAHCVACGADRIELAAGAVRCYACGAHFRVAFEPTATR